MTNPVLDCIQKRRAIRSFRMDRLPQEQIDALVEAAIISPSAMNRQPWHITVVQNREIITTLENDIIRYFETNGPEAVIEKNKGRNNKIFYNSPAVFFISVSSEDGLMDVGIVAQTICLAATSMGLGSVVLGMPQVAFLGETGEAWKQKLQFPEGYNYGIAVAVGEGLTEGIQRDADQTKVNYID